MIPYIDFHCDTLMMFALPPRQGEAADLYQNHRMLDLVRMKEGGVAAQFFATFMPPARFMPPSRWEAKESDTTAGEKTASVPNPDDPSAGNQNAPIMSDEEFRTHLYNGLMDTIKAHSDLIAFARGVKDYEKNKKEGKMSAFLTFEDGRMVEGSFRNLEWFYELGYRLISLTWNFENCFGYPNSKDPLIMEKGLKPFGKEGVEWMMERGIITDVSHLSDGGFWDVSEISLAEHVPFIASHSCARGLTPHTRNLTDEMLKRLGECGGFVGVNFAPEFVGGPEIETPENTAEGTRRHPLRLSSVKLICDHVEYMANVAGLEAVGIGSDFDGIGGKLEVGQPTDMFKLFDEMKKRGWSDDAVEKFAYKNAERILKETLK